MNRRLLIVAAVIGFHVLGLWALQAGLLRRAVELVLPVTVMAELIEPPQPLVTPEPAPPRPQPAPKPVAPVQRVVKPAPMPLAIPDPAPAPETSANLVSEPPAPTPEPASRESAVTAPAAPLSPPPPPVSSAVADNFRALPPPKYPPMSNRLREQGSVHLDIRIEADGTASSAIVTRSSGFPRLDDAAVAAALTWRYVKKSGGPPRPDTYQHVVRFELY